MPTCRSAFFPMKSRIIAMAIHVSIKISPKFQLLNGAPRASLVLQIARSLRCTAVK